MALTKTQVANARKELDAALATVAAKIGIDFSIGRITFTESTFRCKLEAVVRGATGAAAPVNVKSVALQRNAYLLGNTFDETKNYRSPSLGTVKFVGYNAAARKYPFVVLQVSTGKRYKLSSMSSRNIVTAGAI